MKIRNAHAERCLRPGRVGAICTSMTVAMAYTPTANALTGTPNHLDHESPITAPQSNDPCDPQPGTADGSSAMLTRSSSAETPSPTIANPRITQRSATPGGVNRLGSADAA